MQDNNLKLEDHVARSASMLILLGSPKYFGSENCVRELRAAEAHGLPLIFVHDANPNKNGATLEDLQHACPAAFKEWLFGEAAAEDAEAFEERVIPWHRVTDFQVATTF